MKTSEAMARALSAGLLGPYQIDVAAGLEHSLWLLALGIVFGAFYVGMAFQFAKL
jgi:hypothetical protein